MIDHVIVTGIFLSYALISKTKVLLYKSGVFAAQREFQLKKSPEMQYISVCMVLLDGNIVLIHVNGKILACISQLLIIKIIQIHVCTYMMLDSKI